MVRASSISPVFTITVGLCVANAMTGLSGGLLAQYQRSCDINIGTGQVTIALASLIIGETLVGKGQCGKTNFWRHPWKLPVPFHRGNCTSIQCPGRMPETGIIHYRSSSDFSAVSETESGVCKDQTCGIAKRKRGGICNAPIIDISKTFNPGTVNAKQALSGLSLHLDHGDFVTIIGSNGAGKSTLFNAIAGSFYVDDGFIELDGEDITYMPEHKRSLMVDRLFQDPLKERAGHDDRRKSCPRLSADCKGEISIFPHFQEK